MIALFTRYRAPIVAPSIALAITLAMRPTHLGDVPMFDIGTAENESSDRRTAAMIEAPPIDHDTSTITAIIPSWDCGDSVGITQIRYGNDFGVVIPCIELQSLRFAVGDTQTVLVDDHDRVVAIRAHGVTQRFGAGFETVRTPATAIGHMRWSIASLDSHVSYETDGSVPPWSWSWANER